MKHRDSGSDLGSDPRRDLVPIFGLLRRYYAHELTRIDPQDWPMIGDFAHGPAAQANARIAAAIARIAQAPAQDIERLEYDFNALFVGPDRKQAAPFETVYRSPERTLMRHTTMSVREAYLERGMAVDAKNVQPDDHAAYECAFVEFLLERGEAGDAEALDAFVVDHLARWVPQHAAIIREASSNEVCCGFADLFETAVASLATEA